MPASVPLLSVVLPCYNERENLEALRARLVPILERLTQSEFEVIFVDDASQDGCSAVLAEFQKADSRIKSITFSRNFGHQAALSAGLELATGAAVILMDSDLQDPPEIIERFFERWQAGFDVVYAVREKRKENAFKRAAYALFYRTLRVISEIDIPLDAGDFCLLDRRVVDALVAMPERSRFIRGLRSWVGFRQVAIPFERAERHAGAPKYTLSKLLRLAVSGYVGFSSVPLQLASWMGLLASGVGFALGAWAIGTKLLGIPSPRGWASTVALVLFVGGMQLLVLGVHGEYLSRVYDEVRRRPAYVVREWRGFDRAGEARPPTPSIRRGGAAG